MNPDWRKPAGALAIVAIIAAWTVLIATFSETLATWHWLAQLAFYVVTGIVWITPLKPLLQWMETGRWR